MKPISQKGFSFILNNSLYWSAAYQKLTPSARNLMWCMFAELRWIGKLKNKQYTNNGQISFSEKEFKDNGLGCSSTYEKSRNLLIEVGFIKITYRGGMARGDMNKYRLLWVQGVQLDQKRWKRYPEENWEHEIPRIKDYIVGKETRFKKKSYTLKKHTLNAADPPSKVDPINANPPSKVGSKV